MQRQGCDAAAFEVHVAPINVEPHLNRSEVFLDAVPVRIVLAPHDASDPTRANHHAVTFTYDSINRVSTMRPTDGSIYSYSCEGFGNSGVVVYPTGYCAITANQMIGH
jgi:hypothetical protein